MQLNCKYSCSHTNIPLYGSMDFFADFQSWYSRCELQRMLISSKLLPIFWQVPGISFSLYTKGLETITCSSFISTPLESIYSLVGILTNISPSHGLVNTHRISGNTSLGVSLCQVKEGKQYIEEASWMWTDVLWNTCSNGPCLVPQLMSFGLFSPGQFHNFLLTLVYK